MNKGDCVQACWLVAPSPFWLAFPYLVSHFPLQLSKGYNFRYAKYNIGEVESRDLYKVYG